MLSYFYDANYHLGEQKTTVYKGLRVSSGYGHLCMEAIQPADGRSVALPRCMHVVFLNR